MTNTRSVAAKQFESDRAFSGDREFKVGVWLVPQHTAVPRMRSAWRQMDELGVDSIWLWDHFFPLTGDPDGAHFEGWSLLAAMAAETSASQIGLLVSNIEYRNPDLLADMARTVDHLSGGRTVLGLGAGWVERDYEEYGYEFRPGRDRAAALAAALPRIKRRLAALNPPPVGNLPLLIAGDGRKVMLRLAAQHGAMWNTMAWNFAESNQVLNDWCAKVGRDPDEIERTCFIVELTGQQQIDELVAAGAQHIIIQLHDPFDPGPVRELLGYASRQSAGVR
ncbi:MAG TPA: LLM class F420-dependent oxidoreductase [Streptosporangiaceae bacterium]|jgi:probable F420-dependent oxidoreductase